MDFVRIFEYEFVGVDAAGEIEGDYVKELGVEALGFFHGFVLQEHIPADIVFVVGPHVGT